MKLRVITILLFLGCKQREQQKFEINSPSTKAQITYHYPKVYFCGDTTDSYSELTLKGNHQFEFNDMRNESCWLWYVVQGKWIITNDTLTLSPFQEGNLAIKLRDRVYLIKNDSLILRDRGEANKYINWGDFRSTK